MLISRASTFTGSAQIHDVEALAQPTLAESEDVGHPAAPAAQEAVQLIAPMSCLRLMSLQGGDLAVKGAGDVDGMGHVGMGHYPDLVDVPRLQALLEQLGPRESVLGGGIDGTDGGFACGEMIRVGSVSYTHL